MNSSFSVASSLSTLSPHVDLLCFSHLRWDFVTQRPQHLLNRAAKHRRVFYWEEPFRHEPGALPPQADALSRRDLGLPKDGETLYALEVLHRGSVTVLRPHLCNTLGEAESATAQKRMLEAYMQVAKLDTYIAWYYTPMALAFTSGLQPEVTVYDCMDELSLFHGAPPELCLREQQLLEKADVVFTGGISLYEAKRHQHANVHAFPSSIDVAHFAAGRKSGAAEPADQADIPHPRAGFCGVLDERLDAELLRQTALLLPEVHFVLIGPVVKIDPASLPTGPNLHYLGGKRYEELPAYMAGWDVALLPFAKNDATRFISPTKTPEYLAAGRPVVSTSIRDVVRGYGDEGLVAIADTPAAFAASMQQALQPGTREWQRAVDRKLAGTSWDRTWSEMEGQIAFAMGQGRTDSAAAVANWKPAVRDGVERLLLQNGGRTTVLPAVARASRIQA